MKSQTITLRTIYGLSSQTKTQKGHGGKAFEYVTLYILLFILFNSESAD